MRPAGSYRSILIQPAFVAYLITQFITAFNDNVFKIVVMLIALQTPESGYVDFYYIAAQFYFILPFFFFCGYSGYFSDKYPKNKVIIATKFLEVGIIFFALYFLANENKPMLIAILFLLSSQSVFLSPAKYGILPEWFTEAEISRVNGLVELVTFIAIIFGSAVGGILMQFFSHDVVVIGIILLILSVIGLIASFFVKTFPASGADRAWSFNPWHETISGIKVMRQNHLIATTIAGISFFFALALAATTNLLVFGKEIFALNELQLGLLNASVGLGIGVGSLLAGWLSGDKIELGLIPMGAIGLTVSLFAVSYTTSSVLTVYLILITTGIFAGLFMVPLNAMLQELPEKEVKGRLIGTNNFFNGAAMLFAVLLVGFLQGVVKLSSDNIMFVLAWITLVFSIITLSFNPRFFVRFLILFLIHIFYRINVIGSPNIPKKGPALIVSNHVSYIDGLIISSVLPRFIRYLAYKDYYYHPLLYPLFRFAYAIPIESGNEQMVSKSIELARKALIEGHVVCIFAEGRLTRTGNLLPFKTGLERIVEGLDVPIIPIHLDQLWASVFSPRRQKQLFRIPQQFPAYVTVTLGDPMPSTSKAWQVRQAVQELAVQARVSGHQREHYLSVEFLKAATNSPNRYCIYDEEQDKSYKYAGFSSKVLYVANKLKKIHLDEDRIGVFLPSSYKSALINLAITTAGKSVVNIPVDCSYEQVLLIKKKLNLYKIYSYRDNLVGLKLIEDDRAIDIERVLDNICNKVNTYKWRLIGVLKYILPVKWVVSIIGKRPSSPEQEVAVLLPKVLDEDGSERAENKFVILSHESVYNNISGLKQLLDCNRYDRFASILPFHGTFGFTDSLWAPLIIGNGVVPVSIINLESDANKAIEVLFKQQTSILIAEFKFLEYLLGHIPTNLLARLRYIICIDPQASNLSESFSEHFYDKFGIQLLSGFGLPELGSLVALNIPNVRTKGSLQRGSKRHSVGHPLPNVAARIVDVHNDLNMLEPGNIGRLEVKTPARMLGYSDKTIVSDVDQWFNTNLMAKIDDEGFIFLV
ncbi:MAG: MFS transporter [Gammaproteobacteria bacterium]|nr:MFS transporter [Gammaproteobacteria bacterium]